MLESLLIGERFYAFRCSPAFNWSVYVFQDDTVFNLPREVAKADLPLAITWERLAA